MNQRRTAVIVEDDPDVAELLELVLTQSGYECHVAANGVAGLEAVRSLNPLLTTLDVSMPGMDGFAVARRIREFSSTYLIMITALNEEIDIVMGLEAGADDYLVKPFRPRELRARAESMLRRPRERGSVGAGSEAAEESPAQASEQASEQAPAQVPSAAASTEATERADAEAWAVQAKRAFSEGNRATIGEVPPPLPDTPPVPAAGPAAEPAATIAAPAPSHRAAVPAAVEEPLAPAATFQPAAPSAPLGTPASRMAAGDVSQMRTEGGWVAHNGLLLNPETRVVTVDGRGVDLNRVEFDLLASLLSTGRRVRSKADLVLTMRGQDYVTAYFVNEADKRAVEGHIDDLRRKLRDDAAVARFIEPVRGVGFRMAAAA